jgi:multidrug efflux system outer membrane protein
MPSVGEPDFWHALSNGAHAQKRLAQTSAADLAMVRLSLQAELANDYIAVRGLDTQLDVLRQSIARIRPRSRLRGVASRIADGLDSYLSVSIAQIQALATDLTEVQLRVRQIQAAVSLIRALGGGWTVQALPDEKQTLQFTDSDYGVSENP